MILGYGVRFLPLSSRIMANYLKQIPHSMEEAGTVTGASWFRVLGNIFAFAGLWTTRYVVDFVYVFVLES